MKLDDRIVREVISKRTCEIVRRERNDIHNLYTYRSESRSV